MRSLWTLVAATAMQTSCAFGSTGAPGATDASEADAARQHAPAPAPRAEAARRDDESTAGARTEAEESGVRLTPRTVSWEECLAGPFRPAWLLPEQRADGGQDLVARMRSLVDGRIAWKVDDGSGGTRIEERRLGDIVLAVRDLSDAERATWLRTTLVEHAPDFARRWSDDLAQLLLDAVLFDDDWKPSRNSDADGILFGESWNLEDEEGVTWPLEHDPRVEQAAALFLADMVAIKEAESDYRAYPSNVGADYEAIYPLADSFVEGVDEAGNQFHAHTLYFRSDLPFPFSDYECNLHVLSRTNTRGDVVTDIYGPGSDFHYMGGRDTFLPVTTAGGEWLGYLNVRWFGFDLDGVPDGAGDRKEAMRGSLGNLRRNAQRRFAESGGERRCETGVVPIVPIRGDRSQ